MMKSLFEELGGTYTLGDHGMLYPDLVISDKDPRPIGKWGRMHVKYLEAEHPGLYDRLILNGALYRHLADANERATSMLERLIDLSSKLIYVSNMSAPIPLRITAGSLVAIPEVTILYFAESSVTVKGPSGSVYSRRVEAVAVSGS